MYMIVGLGNPGKEYDSTRHNIGFDLIDYIVRDKNLKPKKKFNSIYYELNTEGKKVILLKPQTYMNLSGNAVREAKNFYKIKDENLLVVYDDVDIEKASIRIRKKGSAGTHNGMKDIIFKTNTADFPRLRIGIGSPNRIPLKSFVLTRYKKSELSMMEDAIIRASEAVFEYIKNGVEIAMNKYNG